MNLSLAHPSFCGCLPCLNRRKGSHIPCGLALTAEKTSGPAPVGFAGKAGSVSGAPRVEFSHQSNTTNEVTPMLAESQKPSGLELAQVAAKSGLPTEHGNTQNKIKNSTANAGIARRQHGPRVYASWIDDDPSVVELEFLNDKEDPLAPARGVIFAACMGAVMGVFIVLCVIAMFQRVIH